MDFTLFMAIVCTISILAFFGLTELLSILLEYRGLKHRDLELTELEEEEDAVP